MNPLMFGDSASREEKMSYLNITCDKIDEVLALSRKDVHLVLDDPTGNSYLQSLNSEGVDERLVVEEYTRTREQDEELGVLDMNTENYTS
nr:zinc finger protein ZPR1 [Hymenolepis microstoma]